MKIGFIGLGSMGEPMARNLVKSGYKVTVYNRTPEKAKNVLEAGAELAGKPADAAAEDGIVVTMVSDDQVLEELVLGEGGIGEKLRNGGIHLSMSTVSPETSRKLAEYHLKHGAQYVASPVFGRPDAAESQKLFILSAGEKEARERVKAVQEAMGQKVFEIGEDPGQANIIKLGGNFMIMAAMEAMSEAFNLAEKNGIDREAAAEIYSSTLFNCTVYNGYGQRIAKREFEPAGFQLKLGLKDCGLVLNEAKAAKAPMPMAGLLHDSLLASVAKGRGSEDWAALTKISSENSGLE